MSLTSCIISPYAKNKQGYAYKSYKAKQYLHHRLVYAQHNDINLDDMKNLVVMHTCDNPSCVNPIHLRLGTQGDNQRDKVNKNRQLKGEAHGRCKLTEQQVLDIRASTKSFSDLAIDYRVTKTAIHSIKHRRTWTHI